MTNLKDDLQTVSGVGEATSESIIEILEAGDYLGNESNDPYISKAKAAAEAGEYRAAGVYLRRAGGDQ